MNIKKNIFFVISLVLALALIVYGLFATFVLPRSSLFAEHCAMMPGMVGCEYYRGEFVELGTIFNREIVGLASAQQTIELFLEDGNSLSLDAKIVKKKIQGNEVRMYGYNGQIPGPRLKVRQGSTIYVNFTNNLDQETTVHWHGLRLENAFDGVPEITQDSLKPGESFLYKLDFPDAGIYWYHPHVREDYQQELGLYGNIIVLPNDSKLLNKVNREEYLMIDDIQLTKQGDITPYYDGKINQVLMGRFGNSFLINGQEKYGLSAKKGEVIRFYITNPSNVRVLNLMIPGVSIKKIGSDGGTYTREELVDSVILAPSERATIEVLFPDSGIYKLLNKNPFKTYELASIEVSSEIIDEDFSFIFNSLDENEEIIAETTQYLNYLSKEPDKTLVLSMEFSAMAGMNHGMMGMVMSDEEEGIEWEDLMGPANLASSNNTIDWLIVDKDTGRTNMDIQYDWRVGDRVKIRIVNSKESMHPMQHPIHFHGQRFLVLATDDVPNNNFVWKDTVLVPTGKTVDILLEITNPGEWMAHCHIAEHLSDGMMMSFSVEPSL